MKLKTTQIPDLQFLKECFRVCPCSPSGLVWKQRPWHHFRSGVRGANTTNAKFAGKSAGNVVSDPCGKYWAVYINGITYKAHRLVYCLHTGTPIPAGMYVDHKDRNTLNNHPANLRLVTPSQNCFNRKIRSDSCVGVKGLKLPKNSKVYYGSVTKESVEYWIEPTADREEAIRRIKELRETLHGEHSNHG